MFEKFSDTLTFDDVLLVPQLSEILPKDAFVGTELANGIKLHLPFLSAPMDSVTEAKMAIVLALEGGLGIIHKNFGIDEQVAEVVKVKRFKSGFITHPIAVSPSILISDLTKIREKYGYKKIPVVDKNAKLVGLISELDYFLPEDGNLTVAERMVKLSDLKTAKVGITLAEANQMIHDLRLRVLCVINDAGELESIVTRRDIEKNSQFGNSTKNSEKQLRVGAAVGVGNSAIERAEALYSAGVDLVVVDTAHGHSAGVINTVKALRQKFSDKVIVAGNIATSDAALALVDAGADVVKVGIGPGSICTTRIIAGVGVPQLSAILEVARVLKQVKRPVALIADGGIKSSGDIVKALAAGASAVMMGNMFAGTDESPGRIEFVNGRMYKIYRGMGSVEAMDRGSKDRYGQADINEKNKFVPEGVSGKVPYKGPVSNIVYQLSGGLKSGMGYLGAHNLFELREKACFVKISPARLKESHPHDLTHADNAPNYDASGF